MPGAFRCGTMRRGRASTLSIDCAGDERREEINSPQLGNREMCNYLGELFTRSELAQIDGVSEGRRLIGRSARPGRTAAK